MGVTVILQKQDRFYMTVTQRQSNLRISIRIKISLFIDFYGFNLPPGQIPTILFCSLLQNKVRYYVIAQNNCSNRTD